MWKTHESVLKPGSGYTQLDCRSELQRLTASQIAQDLQCARDDATAQIHWASQKTQSNLSCRVEELKLWKSQMANCITRVDEEISLLEQVKASAETCLQMNALYRQVLKECLTLREGRLAEDLVHDHVEEQLAREVQLCEDIRHLVQQRITEVLKHLRTLQEMRSQLLADQRDKDDAINLNTHCLNLDLQSPSIGYRYKASSITKETLTYEQWVSHCQDMKKDAEKVVLDSSYFRNILQYSLSELINALEAQRSATEFSYRKRLDELIRGKNALEWEKQQLTEAIKELQTEMQKMERQILNFGYEEQRIQTRVDILAQRLNYELCLDQPSTQLQQDTKTLCRTTFTLKKKLLHAQKTLDTMYSDLFNLENSVNEKTHLIGIVLQCQMIRQRLLGLCRIPTDQADSQDSSIGAMTLHVVETNGQ